MDKTLTPNQIKKIMRGTGNKIKVSYPTEDSNNPKHTWYRINAYEAVKSLVGEGMVSCHKTCYKGDVWWHSYDYGHLYLNEDCLGECEVIDEKKAKCAECYQCKGGECISLGAVCDGYGDCPDGEDEKENCCVTNNDHKECYNGDVWWFDGCDKPYEVYEDCGSEEVCKKDSFCGVPCNDECVLGQKKCDEVVNGVIYTYMTCGNHDSDDCLEWSDGSDGCGYGEICKNGECVLKGSTCSPNKDYKDCYSGDVWWFDGCSEPYTKYEDCSANEKCESATCVPTGSTDNKVNLYGKVQTNEGSLAKVKVGVVCNDSESAVGMIKSVNVSGSSGSYTLTLSVNDWNSCQLAAGKGGVMAWNDKDSNGKRDSMEEYQIGPMINYFSATGEWLLQLCDQLDGLNCSADFNCLKTYNSGCL